MQATPKGFIKVHIVSQRPGNPVLEGWQNIEAIRSFYAAPEDAAKIGAASAVNDADGQMYVTESIDELSEAIIYAQRDI